MLSRPIMGSGQWFGTDMKLSIPTDIRSAALKKDGAAAALRNAATRHTAALHAWPLSRGRPPVMPETSKTRPEDGRRVMTRAYADTAVVIRGDHSKNSHARRDPSRARRAASGGRRLLYAD